MNSLKMWISITIIITFSLSLKNCLLKTPYNVYGLRYKIQILGIGIHLKIIINKTVKCSYSLKCFHKIV